MKSKKNALILLILFVIQINLLYSQSVPSDLDKLFTRLDENNQFLLGSFVHSFHLPDFAFDDFVFFPSRLVPSPFGNALHM